MELHVPFHLLEGRLARLFRSGFAAHRERPHLKSSRLVLESLERRELLSASPNDAFRGLWDQSSGLANASAVADDVGNTFSQAATIALSGDGSASRSGVIGQRYDVDMFKIVAPVTGRMTIREMQAAGSRLDPYLYVYNSAQRRLASNDDDGQSVNSLVTINVTAGATYYVRAGGYRTSTGAYTLQFGTAGTATADDVGNTFALATPMSLSGSGAGSRTGTIEQAGDVDMFRFVAPMSGRMSIRQSSTGGGVDPFLYVYNSGQQLMAYNDDADGLTSWDSLVEIDVTAGSTYYVGAAAYGTTTGAYTLQWSTQTVPTEPPGTPPSGGFQIDLVMSGFTAAQQQIVQQAADRWEQIIVGDLPNVTYNGQVIDDMMMVISATPIDGGGGVLGQAGPTHMRSASRLPYRGIIELDTADVAAMQSSGGLLGVLEHEMGHVLGFGVIWQNLGLLVGAGTSNPRFTGSRAAAEYSTLVGSTQTAVPVEAGGGSGTALAHWRESTFGTELMTGWYNSGRTNAISRMTVASMADLGYEVNMGAADPYTYARSTSSRLSGSTAGSSSIRGWFGVFGSQADDDTRRTGAVDAVMVAEGWLVV